MSEKKNELVNAKVDFAKGDVAFIDADGKEIEHKKTMGEKTKGFLKKSVKYSPIGLAYSMSNGIMDKSLKILDRGLNENELNKVENISFDQVIDLIEDGHGKFDELELTFSAEQVNGININRVQDKFSDKPITVDIGKKGGMTLDVKVKYKG